MIQQKREIQKREIRKRTHKVKGGTCGTCGTAMLPQVQSGGTCPCAVASRLPITLGGVRTRRKNRKHRKTAHKRVRFT